MSIIYVDELAIRLPSDVRNTFNPLCAFGSSSNSGANPHNNNRCSAPVMGLREVQSGHVLLPIDAEGSIVVTPGQRYTVVLVRETRGGTASAAEPLAQPAMPPAQKANLSKKERKAARESAAEEHVYGGAAPSSADTDDAPLMAAYRSSQSHTSSRTSPVMEPSTSAESSRHNSKRGSLRSKTETVVAPPPPTRRSLSSIDGYDDEEGAQPLAQLYSAQSAASQPPVPEPKHAGEEETRITATSKKRRSPSEKTTKPTSASTAAPTAAPRVPSPPQPATCTAAEPATKTLRQKSASPDRVPVTLPPSSRTSTVRRVPLDTSSDSD
ncbi:hypothetical protein CGC20_10735 [Leishmania donovani]|uniref:Uncharacterized protein n=1 Tax=Leishmania donovani TaxID=5661 RepID=A0A504Y3P0_LEIDO|nr:hypothetical protein CGC21_37905 [Leishmania donovani]TPP55553.1 hypothetical protein CGC20_10735 [Leishmania donovani]